MAKLNADELESRHGPLLRSESCRCMKQRELFNFLTSTKYRVNVTEQTVRYWINKYRGTAGSLFVGSVTELEQKYGDNIREDHSGVNGYGRLITALSQRSPPLKITARVARLWLERFGGAGSGVSEVLNSGHLELRFGQAIRERASAADRSDGKLLSKWLLQDQRVNAKDRVCQAWLDKDWSTSNKLLAIQQVEENLGQRLRLAEYQHRFGTADEARLLSEELAESQPPFVVEGILLRQWFARYHPCAGPHSVADARQLEDSYGDVLREKYTGLGYKALQCALGKRRPRAVLVTVKTCRTWLSEYGCGKVLRRPAGGSRGEGASMKRPAGAMKRPASAESPPKRPRPQVLASLSSADALEAEVGDRYREEFSDLGLGLTWTSMQRTVREWGYEVNKNVVKDWLRRYSAGLGGKFGGAACFQLARSDLLRWHHVDRFGFTRIQGLLRAQHGVWAHRQSLLNWLKAPGQRLAVLENSIDHHTHACGEAALDRLQRGCAPVDVVSYLRREFLVETTASKLQAYRRYREQSGDYWTLEKLEHQHWQWLYDETPKDLLAHTHRPKVDVKLRPIHAAFCAKFGMPRFHMEENRLHPFR